MQLDAALKRFRTFVVSIVASPFAPTAAEVMRQRTLSTESAMQLVRSAIQPDRSRICLSRHAFPSSALTISMVGFDGRYHRLPLKVRQLLPRLFQI